MPNFKYRAISNGGVTVHGVIEAYDEFEAVDKIKQTCRIVESVKQVDKTGLGLSMTIGSAKIKEKPLALMCSQFSIVLRAGMQIVRAVELIAAQTADKELRRLLELVAKDVATGHGLAQSFENKGVKLLPTSFIETVRAGEESGTLEQSFKRLFAYFDKSAKTKSKVKSAMMYPAFLAVIAVIVIVIILTVAMPVFTGMLIDAGQELPVPTKILMSVSGFFGKYWAAALVVVIAGVIALKLWSRAERGRMALAKLALRLPVLGAVAQMKGASQFANTMATMLSSGLTIIRAVGICSRVIDNYFLGTQLALTVTGLEEGRALGYCMAKSGSFPELLVEMTAVGEETGALEDTLTVIGEYYDSETALASERALSALQPLITVVMGVIIGFIVVALYLPMFSMYG